MDYFYWDTNQPDTTVKTNYCSDCKHGKKPICTRVVNFSSTCLTFEWRSKEAKEDYEKEVLRNQAQTLYLQRGLSIWDIEDLSEKKLLSILTKKHLSQFTDREKRHNEVLQEIRRQQELGFENGEQYRKSLATKTKPSLAKQIKQENHYFYVKLNTGEEKIYRRRLNSKGYKSDVQQLRRLIERENMTLLKEEIR